MNADLGADLGMVPVQRTPSDTAVVPDAVPDELWPLIFVAIAVGLIFALLATVAIVNPKAGIPPFYIPAELGMPWW